eukprot:GHVP01012775.1.p1 GENE.GHVP01012775.1~~GHVP01012775.1.p1  ORF type:complete len:224 (+),score=28.09 GHVP01012775.1:33-674(+)
MEIKLLSDQLNSALEHVTSPQGVGTLPDELIPEPAFELIQRLEVYPDQYAFFKIGEFQKRMMFLNKKRIVEILTRSNPRYSVKTLLQDEYLDSCFEPYLDSYKCDERRQVTFIGFRDPENFDRSSYTYEDLKPGVWQIKVCHCGEPTELINRYKNMLKDSCPCGTFEVTDKEGLKDFGSKNGLASYFYELEHEKAPFKKFYFKSSFSDGSSLE